MFIFLKQEITVTKSRILYRALRKKHFFTVTLFFLWRSRAFFLFCEEQRSAVIHDVSSSALGTVVSLIACPAIFCAAFVPKTRFHLTRQ
jgi:hypothetical protein